MTYRRFMGGPDSVLDFLNNARLVGPFPRTGAPVGGKTLSVGGSTVTFPGEDGAAVPLSGIKQALEREVAGLHADLRSGPQTGSRDADLWFLALYHDDGLAVGKDGTANSLFGFSGDEETTIRPPIADDNIKLMLRPTPAEYEVIVAGTDSDFTAPQPVRAKAKPKS